MIAIKKIKLNELANFIQSDKYLSLLNKPISLARAESYINNPNANLDDIVLYMAFNNNEIIAYRTILTDTFYAENVKHKMGWLSGNWVHPKYRRKNISTLLFNEVKKDWNEMLMYNNYAEASKAVYDKTNIFSTLKVLNGRRFYRRFCFAKVLPQKHIIFYKSRFLLKLIDGFLNLFHDLKFSKKIKHKPSIQISKIEKWQEEHLLFLTEFKVTELFKRNHDQLSWIRKFPWIKTDLDTKKAAKNYYFSSHAKVYKNDFYVIKDLDRIIAIINISIRDKTLKIPYYYCKKQKSSAIVHLIQSICKKYSISYLTVYNDELINELNTFSFLMKKSFIQKYFATKKIINHHTITSFDIQTGDGDGVFT